MLLYWLISFVCYVVQDLFAVSMILPLYAHRARELGGSPAAVGAIGE